MGGTTEPDFGYKVTNLQQELIHGHENSFSAICYSSGLIPVYNFQPREGKNAFLKDHRSYLSAPV